MSTRSTPETGKYPCPHNHPHGVWQLDADYVTEGAACVYLIEQGDRLAIVETGTVHSVPHLLDQIQVLGLSPEQVDYVIPTHVHLDHAAGAGHLMAHCPNARLVIHPRGRVHMVDPAKLEAGTRAVYGDDKYEALYGSLIPVDPQRIIEAPDQFCIDFHGRTFTFIDTPGHANHHFCVHDSGSNSIFSGDTFGISYPVFDTPDGRNLLFASTTPVQFNPEALLQSLDTLAALEADFVYLTHYGQIQPSPDNLRQLRDSIHAFVAISNAFEHTTTGRKDKIAAGLKTWLLEQVQQYFPHVSPAQASHWLAQDIELNAQGLDVWLSRRAKQP